MYLEDEGREWIVVVMYKERKTIKKIKKIYILMK